jgi:hypothetical protein
MDATGLSDDTRVSARHGLLAERLLDETVILDPSTDAYARLNRSGTFLWPSIAEGSRLQDLAQTLADRFSLPPEQARTDVEAFVRMLLERGFVEAEG